MSKTKIIATIGPASFDEAILNKMAHSGLSAVRINTAHIEPGYITKVSNMIDKINNDCKTNIGIMVDLKGPELRTGVFNNNIFNVVAGNKYTISDDNDSKSDIFINHKIRDYVDNNTVIAINDGKIRFRVNKIDNNIETTALDTGEIHSTSRVNIPGKYIKLGTLTDRDRLFLDEGLKNNVNFYALSFVQKAENVNELQDYIYDKNGNGEIISKIETKSGYDNIESIVQASDYIMVARGDLGVELPLKEVVMAQKKIIITSHKYAVPTIVATQMLESMVNSDSPTRAEVSDVTNAIIDDADALMLSEETAIGKYPVNAVSYLNDISNFVESQDVKFSEPENFIMDKIAFSVAKGVRTMAESINVDSIIAFTKSGYTARIISAIRPNKDIYAIVTSDWLSKSINLLKGVVPVKIQEKFLNNIYDLINELSSLNFLKSGQKTIFVSGFPSLYSGGANDIRIITIGKFIGRGYSIGKNVSGKVDIDTPGNGNIIIVDNYNKNFDYSKYDAVIVKSNITNRIIDDFIEKNKTIVYNAEISGDIKDGEEINIDSDTGIITLL